MTTTIRSLHLVDATAKPRTEWLGDREYLVVPTVALIGDNVIHAVNAEQAEFVPASVLKTDGWAKRPLMLGHPVRDGVHVSAAEPSILEGQSFGFTDNPRLNGKRLGVDAWCDVKKLEALGQQQMLANLRAGKPVEVSTGSIVQTRPMAGTHNGKRYASEWATLRADHLAFLPESTGACSVAMGCGANRAAMRVLQGSDVLEDTVKSIIDSETLRLCRDIPQSERDDMSASDFAGPDQSFPIKTQADVDAAKHLIGKAKDPEAVKRRVIAIAKRKGLTIPDAWKVKSAMAKVKALAKSFLKALDDSGDGASGDDGEGIETPADEQAELIAYQAMRTALDSAGDHWDAASSLVDDLISAEEDDPTETPLEEMEEETVEDAQLNALRMHCYSMISSLQQICNATYNQQPGQSYNLERFKALIGKSISAKNMKVIQAAHDASHDTHNSTVALGAQCNGMKLLEAADKGGDQLRAACSCQEEVNMNATERSAALKTLADLRVKDAAGKDVGLTPEEVKALEMLSDKGIAQLRDLAGKTPGDAIIQAKANADAALAAHAHGLNAKDQADAAAKAAKEAPDDKMKAAQAAGFQTVEEHEKAEFYKKNPEIKALVDGAIKAAAEKKAALVEALKALGALTEEQLKAKTVEQLEELAAFARVPKADYSGIGLPRAAEGADDVYSNPPDPYAEALKARRGKAAVN